MCFFLNYFYYHNSLTAHAQESIPPYYSLILSNKSWNYQAFLFPLRNMGVEEMVAAEWSEDEVGAVYTDLLQTAYLYRTVLLGKAFVK